MVFAARLDRHGDLDIPHVHRLAEHLELALCQFIAAIESVQIGLVDMARNIRLVGVPVEQVEGAGLLAQHVIVDHVAPDEIDRPQPVERLGHDRARHDAVIVLDYRVDLGARILVGEDHEVAGIGEVRLRGEISG